jgi:transcriptional regulator of acetoin/glycerol metabolism
VDFLFYAAGQMDISKEDILEELEKRNGIVSIACKSIGLARSTFYQSSKRMLMSYRRLLLTSLKAN